MAIKIQIAEKLEEHIKNMDDKQLKNNTDDGYQYINNDFPYVGDSIDTELRDMVIDLEEYAYNINEIYNQKVTQLRRINEKFDDFDFLESLILQHNRKE